MTNPFPGLPLIESPLFPMQKGSMDLTAEEERVATDLYERGFAVFDFPDQELGARIERIKRNLAPHYRIDFDDPHSNKTAGERRIQDAWEFDADVRAIASNEAVMELLGKLYGRRAFPFQTLNFPVGTQQAVHSDSVHFSSLPERFMCGVWLAMEDVDAGAGPLFYVPGSHRWPILTNALIGRRGHGSARDTVQEPFGPGWAALCEVHQAKPETLLAKKGQALIWCANLLHGGSPQTDATLTRWSQVTHYYFEDCIYYTPAFSDETLGRLDLRKLRAISDGRLRANTYLGEVVHQKDAGKKPRGDATRPSFPRRLMKHLRK